jgi:hypothetical protein
MLKILFLSADPTNATRLRLGEELREIEEKLQLSAQRDQIKLVSKMSVRATDISQAFLDVSPNIVHFSAHGTAAGELCIEDRNGKIHPLQAKALSTLFEIFSSQVNCVVLNACYSAVQAEAIARHVEHVIGMTQEIGDRAAIAFAIGFYQGLGAGRTIQEAYKLGCAQIQMQNISENLTPVLLTGKAQPLASPLLDMDKNTPLPAEEMVRPPLVPRPYNLNFTKSTNGNPDGWFNSFGFVDFASIHYRARVVRRPELANAYCVLFENDNAVDYEFGSLMQRCPARHLAGKMIRLESEMKSENIEHWAGMWLRADGNSQFNLFFENMSKRPIKNTNPWTNYTLDALLPPNTSWLNYGIVLQGRGRLWAANFRLSQWNEASSKWEEI